MKCQYKYKSGTKKGKYCNKNLKIGESKYCKFHQRYIKKKPITPPITPQPKKKTIGTDTNEFKSNISNLLNLYEIISIPLIKEKKEKKDTQKTQEDIINSTEIEFQVDYDNLQNINGLLKIIQLYRTRPITNESTINYDLEKLCRIEQDLRQLNNMIGIKEIKNKICDMIIYLCQRKIHKKNQDKSDLHNEYLHTILQGPPGCGKTTLAHIIASIYKKLGYLSTGKIIYAKRSDLVGKYCGHTAYLTQAKINEAKGGVLFIDEAYSLGNKDNDPDAFSRECIDTLNQNLSEKDDFVCIIAGYKEELEKRFFNVNPGLSRRFPWVFNIEGYSAKELKEMFHRKIKELGFGINESALQKNFFDINKEKFPYFGGSIHTFINKIKICNYKRLFGHLNKKNIITNEDIKNAFEMYEMLEMGSQILEKNKPPMGMYI